MRLPSILGIRGARDKPKDSYGGSAYSFFFGRSASGKNVNERAAMQTTAVYSCVRILAETVASLPVHLYRYTETGKERVYDHSLYRMLNDEPNPEITSFVFRETLSHLLIWGNAYAQIIRDGNGRGIALYPLLPDKMEADRDENGQLYYIYTRNSDEKPNFEEYGRVYLRQQDVLHIPGLGFDGGLLSAEDTETKMEKDVVDLGKEIERLERQAAIDAELNKPTSTPITNKPNGNPDGFTLFPIAQNSRGFCRWNPILPCRGPYPDKHGDFSPDRYKSFSRMKRLYTD